MEAFDPYTLSPSRTPAFSRSSSWRQDQLVDPQDSKCSIDLTRNTSLSSRVTSANWINVLGSEMCKFCCLTARITIKIFYKIVLFLRKVFGRFFTQSLSRIWTLIFRQCVFKSSLPSHNHIMGAQCRLWLSSPQHLHGIKALVVHLGEQDESHKQWLNDSEESSTSLQVNSH